MSAKGTTPHVSCLAVVMEQLPDWRDIELLQESAELGQRVLVDPVLLGVTSSGGSTENGPPVRVHAAIGVPHVVGNVDSPYVVLDNPVVGGGNGTHQDVRLGALGPENVGEVQLVDSPRILVEVGVLRNHVGQSESGVTTWDLKRREGLG